MRGWIENKNQAFLVTEISWLWLSRSSSRFMASDIVRSSYVKIPSPRIDTRTACNHNVIPCSGSSTIPQSPPSCPISFYASTYPSFRPRSPRKPIIRSCYPVRSVPFDRSKGWNTSRRPRRSTPGCSIREGSRRIKQLKVKMFRFLFRTRVCASKPNLFFFFSLFIFPHRYGKIHRFIFRSFFF